MAITFIRKAKQEEMFPEQASLNKINEVMSAQVKQTTGIEWTNHKIYML